MRLVKIMAVNLNAIGLTQSLVQISEHFMCKIMNIFLTNSLSICCGYSKELSQ